MVRRLFSLGDPICDCCSSLLVLWICFRNFPFLFLSFFLVHLPPEHFYWFVQFDIYDPQGLFFFVTYMYFYIEMREIRDDAKNFLTRVFSREKRVTSSRVFRDLNFKNP